MSAPRHRRPDRHPCQQCAGMLPAGCMSAGHRAAERPRPRRRVGSPDARRRPHSAGRVGRRPVWRGALGPARGRHRTRSGQLPPATDTASPRDAAGPDAGAARRPSAVGGPRRQPPARREGDAVEDVVLADDDLVEAELVHEHAQDQRPGADDVDPARVHDRHRRPARPRVAASRSAVTARTSSDGDPRAVDGVGVVGGQLQRERRDRRDRAGQADQAWRPRRPAPRRATSARAARMSASAGGTSLGGRRVAVQVPLGQPHAADVDRAGRPHAVGVAEHELGRAAADVDHQERRPGRGRAVRRGGRGRARRSRRGRTARPPRRR